MARRIRAVNGGAFLERNHERSRAVLMLGSGRSGTTWLAEALARHADSRIVFEPFHPIWTPGPDDLCLFLAPDRDDAPMQGLVEQILEGRTRKAPLGQIVVTRRPASRVLKDIHSNNLAPWYRARFPEVPLVFTVRHPIATARSRQRHGHFYGLGRYLETAAGRRQAEDSPVAPWLPVYDSHRDHPDELVRLVAEWCIENVYPLGRVEDDGALLAFYETAVREPVAELARLSEFCSPALGAGGPAFEPDALRAPSSKDFFGTMAEAGSARDWERVLTRWSSEVPAATTATCVAVVADFGLDRFYGAGPLPLPQAG